MVESTKRKWDKGRIAVALLATGLIAVEITHLALGDYANAAYSAVPALFGVYFWYRLLHDTESIAETRLAKSPDALARSLGWWVVGYGALAALSVVMAVVGAQRRPDLWPLAVCLGAISCGGLYLAFRTAQLWLTLSQLASNGDIQVVIYGRRPGISEVLRPGLVISATDRELRMTLATVRPSTMRTPHRISYQHLEPPWLCRASGGSKQFLELRGKGLDLTVTAAPPRELEAFVAHLNAIVAGAGLGHRKDDGDDRDLEE